MARPELRDSSLDTRHQPVCLDGDLIGLVICPMPAALYGLGCWLAAAIIALTAFLKSARLLMAQ